VSASVESTKFKMEKNTVEKEKMLDGDTYVHNTFLLYTSNAMLMICMSFGQ